MGKELQAALLFGGGIALLFLLPVLGLIFLLFVTPYLVYSLWYNSPLQQERRARAHTEELYNATIAKSRPGEVDIQGQLELLVSHDLPEQIRFHMKAHARAFLDACNFQTDIPPPPTVANSIEGGRYRDQLASLGALDGQATSRVISTALGILDRVTSVDFDFDGPQRVSAQFVLGNVGEMIADIIRDVSENPYCQPIKEKILENCRELDYELPTNRVSETIWWDYFKGTPLSTLLLFEVSVSLPEHLRVQHHQIVASSGHGKTQCIQSMMMDDWETDAAMVVLDSQGDLINNVLAHAPLDRVVLIDPRTCPPALNIFDVKVEGEEATASAIELFEYIFNALETGLTSKQSIVYRYLSRLLMRVPGATLETMFEMFQPDGLAPYQDEIGKMSKAAQSFFAEFQMTKGSQYSETKKEVSRRLETLLEEPTFARMFTAPSMSLNFTELLDSGKIILISTAKTLLKDGSGLFGRVFIALVMQSVMARTKYRRRTYFYIDEFGDYAEDSPVLFNLFEQARKYELGMIVCYQYLYRVPEQLRRSISANTAIKFAGGTSAEDNAILAKQMHTTVEAIEGQPELSFQAWIKGFGSMTWRVPYLRMENSPAHDEVTLEAFREKMRAEYGVERPVPDGPGDVTAEDHAPPQQTADDPLEEPEKW